MVSSKENLEDLRDQNLGRILLRLERKFTAQALNALDSQNVDVPKMSQMSILGHIQTNGSRAVDIAKISGISKQAAGKIIDELKSSGYIETTPDPADSRANIVRFTIRGKKLLQDALNETQKLEKRWAIAAGLKDLNQLKRQLATLLETCDDA